MDLLSTRCAKDSEVGKCSRPLAMETYRPAVQVTGPHWIQSTTSFNSKLRNIWHNSYQEMKDTWTHIRSLSQVRDKKPKITNHDHIIWNISNISKSENKKRSTLKRLNHHYIIFSLYLFTKHDFFPKRHKFLSHQFLSNHSDRETIKSRGTLSKLY